LVFHFLTGFPLQFEWKLVDLNTFEWNLSKNRRKPRTKNTKILKNYLFKKKFQNPLQIESSS
jgi:hypothetical protein